MPKGKAGEAVKVDPVPSDDPEKKEGEEEKKEEVEGKKDDNDGKDEENYTEEELKMKEELEQMVEVITEKKSTAKARKTALAAMQKEIKSSTSSITSVPLPLKFLQPSFEGLKATFEDVSDKDNKVLLADILSIMCMTMGKVGARESLTFRLQGQQSDLGSWGHEYVRNLAGEIGDEWGKRLEDGEPCDDLEVLVDDIVPFKMMHNAEYEAFDMLMEVEQLEKLSPHISVDNHRRVCPYALSCSDYIVDPEERQKVLGIVFDAYLQHKGFADALRVAIKMGGNAQDKDKIIQCFEATDDDMVKKQMGYILAAQRIVITEFEEDEELMEVIGNVHLNAHFTQLAKELDVEAPKTPEDIYKSHLVQGGGMARGRPGTAGGGVDSARQNLAATFVNAFVNGAFGTDTLMTPEGSDWLYKNKAHGMLSAAASLGMLHLWDVEEGFNAVDKFSFSNQNYIKAGALLAAGMLSCGVSSEMDAAYALLAEHIESDNEDVKLSAVFGLGLAYAGSAREDVLELLTPLIVDDAQSMEVVSLACLSMGLVYVGTANDDISGSIMEAFMDRNDTELRDSSARMMALGLGLLYLGQGDAVEAALMTTEAVEHPIKEYLSIVVTTCAYVGSANVLEIQKLVSILSEHIKEEEPEEEKTPEEKKKAEEEKKKAAAKAKKEGQEEEVPEDRSFKGKVQEVAVMGIAMIAMGESVASTMALRALDHTLQYGEINIRRTIPLALGLLSISSPDMVVSDTISKLSHDMDETVSQNAILAMGFLGAGTNNSRLAGLLRGLAAYYQKEPNHLFLVRLAQGLLHMGKGLVSLSPFHSDNLLLSHVSMAGLLTVFHAAMDMKNTLLSKKHYLLYALNCSMRPRMLVTLDEEGHFVKVSVRVGAKVDVVGQAGKPKTITGFQTHETPVLLAQGERAELSTDEYIACTSVLEGFVLVRKNPDSQDRPDVEMEAKEEKK